MPERTQQFGLFGARGVRAAELDCTNIGFAA